GLPDRPGLLGAVGGEPEGRRHRACSEQPELLVGRHGWWLGQQRLQSGEVGAQRGHLGAGLPTAVQDGRRMEGGDDDPPVHVEPLPADPADRHRPAQDHPGGEVPQRHDDPGLDVLDRAVQVRPARFELVGEGIPVPRRAAPDAVRDVHVLAAKADLTEQAVEQLAGRAHERLALLVLVVARRLPDEHEAGLRIAGAEHDLGPALRQPAAGAGRSLPSQLFQRHDHARSTSRPGGSRTRSPRGTRPPILWASSNRWPDQGAPSPTAGTPGIDSAVRTPRRIDSMTASTASASTRRWSASTCPVARENTVSPSLRVCAGRMAPVRPSWDAWARRWARSLVRRALVATTTSVVFVPASGSPGRSRREPARTSPFSSSTSPTAFTAATAPTTSSPSWRDAVPRPAFTAPPGPASLATVAPVPAPTLP